LIDLKTHLEVSKDLRDLAFRSIELAKIPNPNTKVASWSQSVCHILSCTKSPYKNIYLYSGFQLGVRTTS